MNIFSILDDSDNEAPVTKQKAKTEAPATKVEAQSGAKSKAQNVAAKTAQKGLFLNIFQL
jgi:hypothetical protein